MAKPQNVLIGKTKGSIGQATFTNWKGINVLKSKAINSYSDPTVVQVANNNKFGVMVAFSRMISSFISVGFRAGAIKMTEYNAFMKANPYSTVVAGISPNFYVNPNLISISKGPEPQAAMPGIIATTPSANQVRISFNAQDLVPNDSAIYGGAFLKTTGELVAASDPLIFLSDGEFFLGAPLLGTNMALYSFHAFYVNSSNGLACDSIIVLP